MLLPLDPLRPLLNARADLIPALRSLSASVDHNLFLVGGAVRDALLGRPIMDMDLATAADGLQLARRLSNATQGAFVPLDETLRTGRTVLRKTWFVDISSFRGKTIEEDLGFRDFTVNAMAVRLTDALEAGAAEIIDPFGGLDHLREKRMRAVREQAFEDDPLRMLRAFRLAFHLGFEIEDATREWIRRHADHLGAVAAERLQDELAGLLNRSGSAPWLTAMWSARALQAMLPDLADLYGQRPPRFETIARLDRLVETPQNAWEQTLQSRLLPMLSRPIAGPRLWGWLLRFAGIWLDAQPERAPGVEQIEQIATHLLRLSRQEIKTLTTLIRLPSLFLQTHGHDSIGESYLYDLAVQADEDTEGVAALSGASRKNTVRPAALEHNLRRLLWIQDRRRHIRNEEPILTGHDLQAVFHLSPGHRIGEILSRIEYERVFERIRTRERAFDAVRAWMATDIPRTAPV
jgi:tRNA nucleotidyltransferase/poly(A) polymerase